MSSLPSSASVLLSSRSAAVPLATMRRSTRPSSSKRSATRRRRALGASSKAASPSTRTVPAPAFAVKVSMRAVVPCRAMATTPSVTLTPSTKLRTPSFVPSTRPVYCGAPKRPATTASARSSPARRQPAGTQRPQLPRLAMRSSTLPASGLSSPGHAAPGAARAVTSAEATPMVAPATRAASFHVPRSAATPSRNSEMPSGWLPNSSVTARSPLFLSTTMSTFVVGALRTSMRAPTARSPPQPKSGWKAASRGATGKVSMLACTSSLTGVFTPACCQAMRLQRSVAPSASAEPASMSARSGPPAQKTAPRMSRACSQVRGGGAIDCAVSSRMLPRQPAARSPAASTRPPSATSVSLLRASAVADVGVMLAVVIGLGVVVVVVVAGAFATNVSTHSGGSAAESMRSSARWARALPASVASACSTLRPAMARSSSLRLPSSAASAALPMRQRPLAWRTVMASSRSAEACNSPSLVRSGQRPATCALAVSDPPSRGAAFALPAAPVVAGTVPSSGASASRCGASIAIRQSSRVEPAEATRPSACSRLPAAVIASRGCAAPSLFAKPASASKAMPARTLSLKCALAWPRRAASRAIASVVFAIGSVRSKSPLPLSLLAPRANSASAPPGHHGAGSKAASCTRPAARQGASAARRVSLPTRVALASPSVASALLRSISSLVACA